MSLDIILESGYPINSTFRRSKPFSINLGVSLIKRTFKWDHWLEGDYKNWFFDMIHRLSWRAYYY